MAHTILVRLDVDDEYADIHPDITATDYLEGSKAYGWEVVTERVFTESEVRAYEKDLMRALSDPGAFTERHREEKVIGQPFEETVPQWVSRARAIVRVKHGLSDSA